MKDEKVKCSAKPPVNWTPTYRIRLSAYRDAYCMAWCTAYPSKFGRAFYGVEVKWIVDMGD